MRSSNGWCDDRRSGRSAKSASALAALRAGISFAATCRRHTETTSRSTSSGATSVSPANRALACWPSAPSPPSATANTPASTTITFRPNVLNGALKGNGAPTVTGDAVQNLVQSGLVRLCDQTAPKVFLQGLMGAGGTLTQNSVSVLRNVFNLHARHGAIMAPTAPNRNRRPAEPAANSRPYLTPNPMRHKKSGICRPARLSATNVGTAGICRYEVDRKGAVPFQRRMWLM